MAAALLAVVLGLGLSGAYLLRSIDQEYSALVDRSLPVLNELRVLGHDALSSQRALLAVLVAASDADREAAIARAERFIADAAELRHRLGRREIFAEQAVAYALLAAKGGAYEQAAAQVISRLRQQQTAEAEATRRTAARPALDDYLKQLEITARYVESHSQSRNDEISATARTRSAVVFAFAGLPLALGALVVVVIVALISVMILLFRSVAREDGA